MLKSSCLLQQKEKWWRWWRCECLREWDLEWEWDLDRDLDPEVDRDRCRCFPYLSLFDLSFTESLLSSFSSLSLRLSLPLLSSPSSLRFSDFSDCSAVKLVQSTEGETILESSMVWMREKTPDSISRASPIQLMRLRSYNLNISRVICWIISSVVSNSSHQFREGSGISRVLWCTEEQRFTWQRGKSQHKR